MPWYFRAVTPAGRSLQARLRPWNKQVFLYVFFDWVVGTSAGGWNGAYALCEQLLKEGLRLWLNHLPKGFVHWERGFLRADMVYLNELVREREPLAAHKLRHSATDLFVTTTDIERRCTVYVHINSAPDPIASLLVASTMPILAEPIGVNGRLYADGSLTDPIPLRYALEVLSADEIWIILTTPAGYRHKQAPWRLASWLARSKTERELFVSSVQKENETLREIEERHDLVVIRPPHALPLGYLARNRKRMAHRFVALGNDAALKVLRTLSP